MSASDPYSDLRPRAFAIGYQMLGSVSEAEDVVQEGFLRLHKTLQRDEQITSPRAYIATLATRLAIRERRPRYSASRRASWSGSWDSTLPRVKSRRSTPLPIPTSCGTLT
jgi:DNA-directed RNA polymerase specialized sigma24 family protein